MCVLGATAAALLAGTAIALADGQATVPADHASSLFDTKNILTLLGGGGLGGVLAWFGKPLVENINADLAKRREFRKETTGQISKLAQDHYWFLANHAGVLGGMLEEYLMYVDFHLLLEYDRPGALADRLKEIADGYSYQTFYSLCRLLWLFDKFQFEQSNTYLLTTDLAGRSCAQLYNSFIMSLPMSSEDVAPPLDTLAILDIMTRPIAMHGRKDPVNGFDLTEAEFNKMADGDRSDDRVTDDPRAGSLAEARVAYRDWLGGRLDQVCVAAQSLRAYSELLGLELARLYREWSKKVPNSQLADAEKDAYYEWLDALTGESVHAISRARAGSELLQALGRGAPQPRKPAKPGGDPPPPPLLQQDGQSQEATAASAKGLQL
jgi:hypothetical protein